VCHVATLGWVKSAGMCHMARIYWATSAPVGPTPVKSARKWAPPVCHAEFGDKATSVGYATWQYTRQHTSADQSLRN
jgi:hypothetical protein